MQINKSNYKSINKRDEYGNKNKLLQKYGNEKN